MLLRYQHLLMIKVNVCQKQHFREYSNGSCFIFLIGQSQNKSKDLTNNRSHVHSANGISSNVPSK